MTSPLRKAREEVAVNIAVTGFVGRLLPTETRQLAQTMEKLNEKIRENSAEIKRRESVRSQLAKDGKTHSAEYNAETAAINGLNTENKSLRTTLAANRVEMRELQAATQDSLNKIRGFGIALGVAALSLGAFGKGVVQVSQDVLELDVVAIQTGTTIQVLQRDWARLTVLLGDTDGAKQALLALEELRNQLQLLNTPFTNIAQLGPAFALAGLDLNKFVGMSADQIRETFVKRLIKVKDDPFLREGLRRAVPAQLWPSIVAGARGITPELGSFRTFSDDDIDKLHQARVNFGAIRVNMNQMAQTAVIAVAPAMTNLFQIISTGTGWLRKFADAFPGMTRAMGTVIVISLVLVSVVSALTVSYYASKIALTALVGIKSAAVAVHRVLQQAIFRLIISDRALTISTVQQTAVTRISIVTRLRQVVVTKVATAAQWGHVVSTKAATIAQWGHIAATKVAVGAILLVTAAQWLWNAAMLANPIGIVIVGIVGLVAAIAVAVRAIPLVTAAQWLWNAAMLANPIGIVIVGIVGLVAAIVLLIKYEDGVNSFFDGVGITVLQILGPLGELIRMIRFLRNLIAGDLGGGMKNSSVSGFFDKVKNSAVMSLGPVGDFVNMIRFLRNLGGGIKSTSVSDFFDKVRDSATVALGPVGDLGHMIRNLSERDSSGGSKGSFFDKVKDSAVITLGPVGELVNIIRFLRSLNERDSSGGSKSSLFDAIKVDALTALGPVGELIGRIGFLRNLISGDSGSGSKSSFFDKIRDSALGPSGQLIQKIPGVAGAIGGGRERSPGVPFAYSGGGSRRTDIRENVTFNNTYNMQGVTNLEDAARFLSDRQSEDMQSNVASRSGKFALSGA